MVPFLVLTALSIAGLIRVIFVFDSMQAIGLLILIFWVIRNLYFLHLSVFLVDGQTATERPSLFRMPFLSKL